MPVAASAQPASRAPRVGILADGTANASLRDGSLQRFEDGLREHGYVPGSTVLLETRYAGGKPEKFTELAAELAGLHVDVILAPSERGAIAASQATAAIPIVMVLGIDPIGQRLIDSLARPGRNVTGLTADPGPEIIAKRLQLLRELVPRARTIALLTEPVLGHQTRRFEPLEEAARLSGVSLVPLEVSRSADLDHSFAKIARARADAVLVSGTGRLPSSRLCGDWWSDVVRRRPGRPLPAGGRLRQSHPERDELGAAIGAAASESRHQVRLARDRLIAG
jgi:putative ABC transport system substrate-binding protein